MEGIGFEEFVHIRPKPDVWVNVSRRVPSLVEQACRNLQKSFRDRKRHVLFAKDVAHLTCVILLAIYLADILIALCTRKAKHVGL